MTRLSSEQILQEKESRDPASISALILNQKALTDVSCLNEFKNLEKLDLGFNNLSSLEGLSSCINLKWLSVVQNKLRSLKGVESLCKLTVLNAGKNKLNSMAEVSHLVNMRALILNDNEISSICGLDRLTDLNTLVLSRNPIRNIGNSLIKIKRISKLSLSNCRLQNIGSSLVSLVNLREVRLSHNEITIIPTELAHNSRLQNLDLGNNSITSWSDLKVLASLQNLKNLNLQGNPIAENDKSAKKVKKLVPNLQIFNTRPIERGKENEKNQKKDVKGHENEVSLSNKDSELKDEKEGKRQDPGKNEKSSKKHVSKRSSSHPLDNDIGPEVETEVVKRKKSKSDKLSVKDVPNGGDEDDDVAVKGSNRKGTKKAEESKFDPIDDAETSFLDAVISSNSKNLKDGYKGRMGQEGVNDTKSLDEIITYPAKRKKKSKSAASIESLSQTEVGMGGPSTWDD